MPFQQTISRLGIIEVPLYTAPYTVPAGITANAFRRYSFWPQLNGGFNINLIPQNIGLVSGSNISIPGPQNIQAYQQFGGGGNNFPIFVGASLDGTGVLSSPSENILFSVPLPNTNGLQNGLIPLAQFVQWPVLTSQGVGTYVAYDNEALANGLLPFWDPTQGPGGGPMVGVAIVIVAFGSAITAQYLRKPANTYAQLDMFDLGISWNSLAANVTYWQCPAQDGLIYGLFDTAAAAPVIPRQVCAYRPANFTGSPPPPLENYSPVFDDPTLQALWKGAGANYRLDIWKGGWTIFLGSGGTGPTGQAEEIAIANPGLTTYNLLRFVPQDAGAQTMLRTATTFGWQVKIDPNGVLYFNSGAPAQSQQIAYSYSPTLFGAPQFSFTPAVYQLPCYTPCFPLSSLMGTPDNA